MKITQRSLVRSCLLPVIFFIVGLAQALAADGPADAREGFYRIGPGDQIKIAVYQVVDLTLETRVEDNGNVSYPLLGQIRLGGLSVPEAEQLIASRLKAAGYIAVPNVTISVLTIRGYQATVLGYVGKPGRYPLESRNMRLADMIAIAGGITSGGSDTITLTGTRSGTSFRRQYLLRDVASGKESDNPELRAGDLIYVAKAPVFYIYGEVQKPGSFPLEQGMSLMQALATGGGLTPKGTQRGLTVHRHEIGKATQILELNLDDPIQPDDVVYVREGLF